MKDDKRLLNKKELEVRVERETTLSAIKENHASLDKLRDFRAMLRNPKTRPARYQQVDTVDTEPE